MLADEFSEEGFRSPLTLGGTPIAIHIYVEDVDSVAAQAVAAGAKLIKEVSDKFYGDRNCSLEDPYGHRWFVSTHKEDVSSEGLQKRALGSWFVFAIGTLAVAGIAQIVGAPISVEAILSAIVILAAIFLLPSLRGFGLKVKRASWNLAGVLVALCYSAMAFYAHTIALDRVQKFAALEHLDVQSFGALPLPPSIWHWDGLIRAPRGVYETRINFAGASDEALAEGATNSPQALPLEYRFYPDAPANSYIDAAKRLPQVQTVLWFARFPVTRFHKEGSDAIVEISDLRFPHVRPDRPASFTYQVRFGANGTVLSQGWSK